MLQIITHEDKHSIVRCGSIPKLLMPFVLHSAEDTGNGNLRKCATNWESHRLMVLSRVRLLLGKLGLNCCCPAAGVVWPDFGHPLPCLVAILREWLWHFAPNWTYWYILTWNFDPHFRSGEILFCSISLTDKSNFHIFVQNFNWCVMKQFLVWKAAKLW